MMSVFFFFFSSRRRHTRLQGDWSSDVCSSDLRLAITEQHDRMEQEARDLITDLPGAAGFMCDVSSDDQIARLFDELKTRYGLLNGMVHSVAFAPAEELKGEFVNTTREGFRIAHDISVYSLVAVARAAAPLMTAGGGVATPTYHGAGESVAE